MHYLAIVIPVTGDLRVEISPEIGSSHELLCWTQKLVEGDIEALYLREGLVGYIDGDGIEKQLMYNPRATQLCNNLEVGLAPGDFIKGPFVIQGEDEDGFIDELPDDVEDLIKRHLGIELDMPKLRDC